MESLTDSLINLKDPDPAKRREAVENLGSQCGHGAILALAECLEDPNRGVQQAVADALINIGGRETVEAVVFKLDHDSSVVRNLALEVLQKVGGQATDLLVPLLKRQSNDLRKAVADILGETGDASSVPSLVDAVDDPDGNVRAAAIDSLGKLRDTRAIPVLVKLLKARETWIQFSAAEALGKICDRETMKVLVEKLRHCDEITAFSIVEALGELKSKDAVGPLADLLPKASPALRNCVIKTLLLISEDHGYEIISRLGGKTLSTCIIDALGDEDPEVREAALKALGHVSSAEAAVPLLDYALIADKDEDKMALLREALKRTGAGKKFQSVVENHEKILLLSIQALGDLKEEPAVPSLIAAFGAASAPIRKAIVQALGNFKTENSFDLVVEALNDVDSNVRKEAIFSLGKQGFPESVEIAFSFLDKEPHKDIRDRAVDSLLKIYRSGTRKEEILKGFIQRLSSEDASFRELCVGAIGKIDFPEKIKRLESALEDQEWRVRNMAVHSLGALEPDPMIFPLLKKALSDGSENVRISAVQMVSKYEGEDAVEVLISSLNDHSAWVQFHAAEALGLKKEKKAAPFLLALLKDGDGPQTIAAIKALGEIGDRRTLEAIKPFASHEDLEISHAAGQALARLQTTAIGQ
ncbi:MAG: HEAT repeat domain-containing protein [Nitrospinae bacterium]|nr:HEAT repeat domain-containing protein [Nitrospinota bacterium]